MSRVTPGLLVELPAPLDADVLGHGDLHVVDVLAVPERLEELLAKRKTSRFCTVSLPR
jgi:hypothetical protein